MQRMWETKPSLVAVIQYVLSFETMSLCTCVDVFIAVLLQTQPSFALPAALAKELQLVAMTVTVSFSVYQRNLYTWAEPQGDRYAVRATLLYSVDHVVITILFSYLQGCRSTGDARLWQRQRSH